MTIQECGLKAIGLVIAAAFAMIGYGTVGLLWGGGIVSKGFAILAFIPATLVTYGAVKGALGGRQRR